MYQKYFQIPLAISNQGCLKEWIRHPLPRYFISMSFEKCFFPKVPLLPEDLIPLIKKSPQLDCEQKWLDWAVCEKSFCYVKKNILDKEKDVKCTFIELLFNKGLGTYDGPFKKKVINYILQESDVVKVYCKSQTNAWSSVLVGFRNATFRNSESIPYTTFFGIPKNVLVIGFASVSRNTFINKLPRTYEYLMNKLNGDVLQGYNIVEDTDGFSLLYPFLTGKNKSELLNSGGYIDDFPFIWKEFKEREYITAHIDDIALWNPPCGDPNFKFIPTDHYIQQYYINAREKLKFWPQFCSGSIPRHKIIFDYIRDFFTLYKNRRKFLFAFYSEITHSNFNRLDVIDEDLFILLKYLDGLNILRKTLLIIMSDKGFKFSSINDVLRMKQEEMSPFLYIRLPPIFSRRYPRHYMNFQKNIKGLVTPYDLHKTLKHMLDPDIYRESKRAISLFHHIPYPRSCFDAQIGSGLCACWITKYTPDLVPFAPLMKDILESTLNNMSQPLRDKCEKMTVTTITNITRIIPNSDLFRYTDDTYQFIITALVLPGYTLFEARVVYDKRIEKYLINTEEITSFDYGLQSLCVKHDTKLRKFCYCRDQSLY
ncbi:hypothetical protein Trydic_g569 [Trypoxylus dichotomus]